MVSPAPVSPAVLATAADLTPEWVGAVLGADVNAVTATPVGTGQMADTVRVAVSYAPGASGPASLIAKLASADERSRGAAALFRAYEIEVSIYTDLPPLPGLPRCLYGAFDADGGTFTLVLEDMDPCRQGDDIAGTDLPTAVACIRQLAALHAAGWEDPEFAARPWLNRQTPEQSAQLNELLAVLTPSFLERFAPLLAAEHRALVERLVPRLSVLGDLRQGPRTLTHGDYRLDNMLFRDGSAAPTVVDWQTAVWGHPAGDVAYFVGGCMAAEGRRQHAERLLDAYHQALVESGVQGYAREQLAADVRVGSFGGVIMALVAASLVVQTERGDAMFAEMFRRHAQHALDVDALALLEEAS